MTRRTRRSFGAVLATTALLCGCESDLSREHAELAKALASPVATLCAIDVAAKEGGGCQGECRVFVAAEQGRKARLVAERLAALPTSKDAPSEAALAELRAAAKATIAALDGCPSPIERTPSPTPEVARCAEAWRGAAASYRAMDDAVSALAKVARERSGAKLWASPAACPP